MIQRNSSEIANQFKNKTVLVTGGVGSIGSEIVKELLRYQPKVIRVFDNNEYKLFNLQNYYKSKGNLRPMLGDIRDLERLRKAMSDVDIVFHAAALKHVEMSEYNPFEAVKTNITGTQNIIDAALKENVEKVIFISTDKVVNPMSTMGATKLVAERLITSTYFHQGSKKTKFAVVRFGNVLFSNGSVLPIWHEQISQGGPVTITDSNMTRFIMPIKEAVNLVFQAALLVTNGETFILKMPSLNIEDLATAFIEKIAPKYNFQPNQIKLKKIGLRIGEKMYEELISQGELEHLYETENMFIVFPGEQILNMKMKRKKHNYKRVTTLAQYSSDNEQLLTKNQIKKLLEECDEYEDITAD